MKKNLLLIQIVLCGFFYSNVLAQMEGDQWVMGYYNKNNVPGYGLMYLDFHDEELNISYYPTIKIWMSGCASNICSNLADPIIWTNGMQIMGKGGVIIADTIAYDGDGLYWITFTSPGHVPFGFPEPDNAIILPIPGLDNEYTVIYHYNEVHPRFLLATTQYLEARIRQKEDGSFELLSKDIPIGPRNEWYNGTISAVRHANGRDWWLIYFLEYSTDYFVHLLDPSGIHFDHIGKLTFPILEGLGQSVFSNSGNYFARMDAISQDSGEYVTLFNFDRCFGDLEIIDTFHLESGTFTGVAFSPSEKHLYANSNLKLWQWDIESENIKNSKILIDTFDGFVEPGWLPARFGPMGLAPDGRIYLIPSTGSSKFVHVIERPDNSGQSCKFTQHSFALPTWNARTIPNIPNYKLGPLDGSPCDTLGLDNLPVSKWRYEPDQVSDPFEIKFTDLSYFEPEAWSWDFGDGGASDQPSPLHTFEPGYYHVCQTVSNQYASDSTCKWIEILPTDVREERAQDLPDISISPNPFQDFISIESRTSTYREVDISIYDIHGRLIFEGDDLMIPSKLFLPDFPPGLLMCVVTEKNSSSHSFKLMKL